MRANASWFDRPERKKLCPDKPLRKWHSADLDFFLKESRLEKLDIKFRVLEIKGA